MTKQEKYFESLNFPFLFGCSKESSCHAFSLCISAYTGIMDLVTVFLAIIAFMAILVIMHQWLQITGCDKVCEECYSCMGTCIGPCDCTEERKDNCRTYERRSRMRHKEMATNTNALMKINIGYDISKFIFFNKE